ncbi:MAG: hypothetical protein ACK5BP_12995, partial [Planctomyces sp.]
MSSFSVISSGFEPKTAFADTRVGEALATMLLNEADRNGLFVCSDSPSLPLTRNSSLPSENASVAPDGCGSVSATVRGNTPTQNATKANAKPDKAAINSRNIP